MKRPGSVLHLSGKEQAGCCYNLHATVVSRCWMALLTSTKLKSLPACHYVQKSVYRKTAAAGLLLLLW